MPPHCDSLDGPVVSAARLALDKDDVNLVLPFVPEEAEDEVRTLFDAVTPVRRLGDEARAIADLLFFETVVRLHRAGEGAPYTGLKPAGLSVGPVIPLAETAIETGASRPVSDFLVARLRQEIEARLERVNQLSATSNRSLRDARLYVEAMLGFEVYSHHLFQAIGAEPTEQGQAVHHHH